MSNFQKSLDIFYGVKGVAHLFPEREEKGVAIISTFEFNERENVLYNMKQARDGNSMFIVREGKYARLHINGQLMMSDTGMERTSNREFIEKANGKVLIAGLGIGLVLANILEKESVSEVIVIEKYQDVIDLVASKFNNPKLKIICADIDEWLPQANQKFDTIYFDIWEGISTENLEQIQMLHKKFRRFKNKENPNSYMNSWMKEFLQKRLRKERREEAYYKPFGSLGGSLNSFNF